MIWANFLHFYQPYNQQKDILEAVVNQCYRPLLKGLLANDRAVLTVNVAGGLLEALDAKGFGDVIELFSKLYRTGRVEFTATACYHAFLPLLPEEELVRQIETNTAVLQTYLSKEFSPKGFFPPEMGYAAGMEGTLTRLGFSYILLDEIAQAGPPAKVTLSAVRRIKASKLKVVFRQRAPSNLIMSGLERDAKSLQQTLLNYDTGGYLVTAMDAETFGHHRIGLDRVLLDMFNSKAIEFVKLGALADDTATVAQEVVLQPSTWASSLEDIHTGIQFISWNDPANEVHGWQWELVQLMLLVLAKVPKEAPQYAELRRAADRALASDQFFWACAKPWWSVEMIEAGVYAVLYVIETTPDVQREDLERAQSLYRKIVSTAFEWQRNGKIRELNKARSVFLRIPFKERTLEQGGSEAAVYRAFIAMLRDQERLAKERGDYEKAILWRDAVYKIETKCDIYDAINAIDLLRIEVSNAQVEKVLDAYTEKYRQIKGGQPEQRSN